METKLGANEKVHTVQQGETLKGISAAALEESFGKPTTHKEWTQRAKDVAVEQEAIVKRNGLTNAELLSTGNHDKGRGPIEPAQVLYVPDPKELFSK